MSSSIARQLDLGVTPPTTGDVALRIAAEAFVEIPTWVPLAQLYEPSPGSPSSRGKWGRRRAKQIRRETNGQGARMNRSTGRPFWEIHRDQIWHDGKTVGELVAPKRSVAPPPVKPPGWDQADDKDKQRHLDTEQAARWWADLRREFPTLTDRQRHPIFVERYGKDLKVARLGCSLATIKRYTRRTDP
ncbi:MAG: sigma-70 family RNA polymerase sigma factor, partial [Gemmatimonadota bacterium]